MKIERIKELFFSTTTNYPFPSNELYLFFGFNRHNNFIRVLKKDEYDNDVTIKPWETVHQRKSDVYYISRNLFYMLCEKFLKNYSDITQIYLDYKHNILKSKILNFAFYPKKDYIFKLNVTEKIKGHYYTYSLNTLNIAKDLNIDIYDLFKFCSLEFCSKYGYGSANCVNESRISKEAYPYYSFDSMKYENRYLFVQLLTTIKDKYKLTGFQKQVIDIYSDLIKQMLEKQLEYDIKEHRKKEKQKAYTFSFKSKPTLSKEQEAEMKIIYRKAAMLCHPDKNKDGEEIFKELNNANKNNDLQKVKEIFNRLSRCA